MSDNKEKKMNVLDMSKEIGKAAKTVAHQWPTVVEADDLEQNIYLHLLERPGSVEKLLTEFGDKDRLNALIAIGHQIANEERSDYEIFSGNFRYSVNEVKRILGDREDADIGSSWSIAEDFISNGGEFEDAVVTKSSLEMDLARGMERLEAKYKPHADIIRRRYYNPPEILTTGRDKQLLSEALTALTTQMNRSFKQQQKDHNGPGSRKPITAQQAHYKSKKNWDDESSEAVQRLMNQARVSGR